MVLLNVYELIVDYIIGSPLDQFGDDDEDMLSILDYSILDNIPGAAFLDELFDWSALGEIDSLSD